MEQAELRKAKEIEQAHDREEAAILAAKTMEDKEQQVRNVEKTKMQYKEIWDA